MYERGELSGVRITAVQIWLLFLKEFFAVAQG